MPKSMIPGDDMSRSLLVRGEQMDLPLIYTVFLINCLLFAAIFMAVNQKARDWFAVSKKYSVRVFMIFGLTVLLLAVITTTVGCSKASVIIEGSGVAILGNSFLTKTTIFYAVVYGWIGLFGAAVVVAAIAAVAVLMYAVVCVYRDSRHSDT